MLTFVVSGGSPTGVEVEFAAELFDLLNEDLTKNFHKNRYYLPLNGTALASKRGKDPKTLELSFNDWRNLASDGWKRFPQAVAHLRRLDKLFNDFDKGQSGTLDFGEHRELLGVIDSKVTSQPATAQARQSAGRLPGQEAGIFAVVTADPDEDASDGLNQISHLEDSDGRRGQHRRKQEVVLGANDSDMVIVRVQLFEQGNAASATTQYDQSRLVFHDSFRIGVIVVDQDVGNG
ncbi:External alternative NAD(P)H-ubiquinone oxidoreductase B1 [Apiospora arundinis]